MDVELLYTRFYQAMKEQKFAEAKSIIYEAHREGMPAGHILVKLVNRTLDNLQKNLQVQSEPTLEKNAIAAINFTEIQHKYFNLLINGKRQDVHKIIDDLLAQKIPASDILLKVITPSMDMIGSMQSRQEISLSQIFITAKITDDVVAKLLPLMPARSMGLGKIVIGNPLGDHHSLGRKIVTTFLRFYGFEVIDIGENSPNEKFVESVIKENAKIIFISAFLLHTAKNIPDLRNLLNSRGLQNIKIVVGGAPFNFDTQLYKQLNCDAYAPEGLSAVKIAKQLLGITY